MQAVQLTDPEAVALFPAGQSEHSAELLTLLYSPGGQVSHEVPPPDVPAGHEVHLSPEPELVPLGHAEHVVDPAEAAT